MDRFLRALALMSGLIALAVTVLESRVREGRFPLITLAARWMRRPAGRRSAVGVAALAGVVAVVAPVFVAIALGWCQVTRVAGALAAAWWIPAALSVAVKAAYVVFEEWIFRGALINQLRRWLPVAAAVGVSALLFTVAHAGRTQVGLAILLLDGIGFGALLVATGSLWPSIAWHLSKNLTIWTLYGSGSLQLVPGPWSVVWSGPALWVGAGRSAGLLDLAATVFVLALVLVHLSFAGKRWQSSTPA